MRGLIRILALLAVAALIVDLIGMSGTGVVTAQSGPNPAASPIGFMPNPSMESGGLSSFLLLVEGLIVSVRSVGLLIAAAATQLPTLFGYLSCLLGFVAILGILLIGRLGLLFNTLLFRHQAKSVIHSLQSPEP